jgi:hypothetical protein
MQTLHNLCVLWLLYYIHNLLDMLQLQRIQNDSWILKINQDKPLLNVSNKNELSFRCFCITKCQYFNHNKQMYLSNLCEPCLALVHYHIMITSWYVQFHLLIRLTTIIMIYYWRVLMFTPRNKDDEQGSKFMTSGSECVGWWQMIELVI